MSSTAEPRLITVAIHTYDHAVALKALLEGEGVKAVLQNVNLSAPVVSSGVRVRILEGDLPKALRIIENRDIFLPVPGDGEKRQEGHFILVPVDFTEHSIKAVDIAFGIGARHHGRIVLLNAFLDPDIAIPSQLSDTLSYEDVADAELRRELDIEARHTMELFARRLRERIKSSELPAVKFTTEVLEGLPEEVITEYAKENVPSLIVMGTRESDKKGRELVGSVTAEVLDSCRFPIITIPESASFRDLSDLHHAVLFCNLDQDDILTMDALYGLFADRSLCVTLISIPDRKGGGRLRRKAQSVEPLLEYCREHYPRFEYHAATMSPGNLVEDFEALGRDRHIDFIVVSNKKKNMFARLFNPSLAHRLLFHADIPMMAIPV
ncbi:universal stress protein [Muribaculum intestinale]|uniref:Universal stress protein n=1 Tax=Muribaculum intestinale TaxID=1796646 RepID=A0A4S2FYW2_9BACT|nr:universal stress protein [Muribaculum intestinale]MYM12262.1 universal stress protein [Muribaculum intestinale]TGY74512.1 universal stress protein [Muribaculum intestinale]